MVASIGCSFSGTVLLLQNHYPRFRRAPSGHFRMLTRRPPSVDSGLGVVLGQERKVEHAAGRLVVAITPDVALTKLISQGVVQYPAGLRMFVQVR